VAGSYALTLQVTAEDDPTSHASTVVALTVGSGGWLDMGVQPAEVDLLTLRDRHEIETAEQMRLAALIEDRLDEITALV
jgi:hypothetical protein